MVPLHGITLGLFPRRGLEIGGEPYRDFNDDGAWQPGEPVVAFGKTEWDRRRSPGFVVPAVKEPTRNVNVPIGLSLFLAVGMYGRVLPNQNGAPLRLIVPWKYGFKSAKSIVRIGLTEDRPATSWNQEAPREYGFYANVNPAGVPPRRSQKDEKRAGELYRRPTQPFNGYGEQVAQLYAGLDLRRHF